ncbi:CPBP family intramembrane glutamic endopeptidase [Staphylococcus epidermidis]|uniref:CPBP family intramembrane glutamic endopeptidase n=1 Tax=Staphylococcus epidermidis TaxID=1282 RepID=UPI000207CD74|nr:CPBP family intramembrane glutamic endopeptidase [Staphylococcus epidermidis]EGG71326.1 CAAX amino terminal protease family protein [Staphylococcus epidermidis VCU028]EHQ79087.1 CAAX amino terminal protease self- immunity [Staphylococcus epidermidis VCU081]MDF1467698.1 lysostaphin resistance A-like protein [Staphylococcus epidermidis]
MSKEEQHCYCQTQTTVEEKFKLKKIVKRDFLLVPLYVLAIFILPDLFANITTWILAIVNGYLSEDYLNSFYNDASTVYAFVGEAIVILIFYLLHKRTMITTAMTKIKELKKYIPLLIICALSTEVFTSLWEYSIDFLPEQYQYYETVNEEGIEELFTHTWITPILFIDIVIFTPIIEELLFRHLIIHELGKKLTYGLMYIVSIVGFTYFHCTDAVSPFEAGSYFIAAVVFVIGYHFSHRNLAVPIALHMITNLIAF